MNLNQKTDQWFRPLLQHPSDTPETLEEKLFLIRIFIIPAIIISLSFIPAIILQKYQLILISTAFIWPMIITVTLLLIIKRGIKWFYYFHFGGYIIICCLVVISFGGLPNSLGAWGGSVLTFLIALGVRYKRILLVNGVIYCLCLIVMVILFPYLVPLKEITPAYNNYFFTFNEVWMCLNLVQAFSGSIMLRTEESKSRAAQLQELDILKSKLYANIAHEFRTPLTMIRGNAEEILEHYGGKTQDRASVIKQNSDKVLFLVNQMLDLSKIEEGGLPVHYVQGDLVSFTRFIVNSFQGYAESRKVRLHYTAPSEQLLMDIEAEKLEGALSNLLSNAIKYTPRGGDIQVKLDFPISGTGNKQERSSEKQVEISVRDTGIGIPEDQLDKIFIRFYRVEDKRYSYQEGTGIGLTLVSEYLKLMKGSIRVSSQPGKGSEFIMTLPVTRDAEIGEVKLVKGTSAPMQREGYSPELVQGDENGHPSLLIIEDNKELTEYLTGLLGKEYSVISAENGIRGIELAIEHIPDIILSDVMMPGKDGYQVCKQLKNDFRTNHIPIVLITARADTDSRIIGLEHGADAYLTKPFDKKEMRVCLHNLFVQRENLRLKYQSTLLDSHTVEHIEGLNDKFLNKATELLEKNYRDDSFGIEGLYQGLRISRVQLHRKLTAITGQSTSNFIRSYRLKQARKLLLESDQSVTDVAYQVGFADANYFSKAFILEYGLTASEVRKSFN